MIVPHLRGGGFHVPLEVVQPALAACGIEVTDSTRLHARCPAEDLHTTSNKPGDCVIFPNNGVPRIFCHHRSCSSQINEANAQLRSLSRAFSCTTGRQPAYTLTQSATWQQKQRWREALAAKATALLPAVLEKYHWPVDEIAAASPVAITLPVERQHRYIFDLFDDDDVLWCAPSVRCTGSHRHEKHFRKASRWARESLCPGAFVCPNPFEVGASSRSDSNIARVKFLILESDKLDRNQVGAVFRWLKECYEMALRAVVDTGRRSLHAWFELPAEGLTEKLEIILSALGCDPAMFRPAQPCRLPGVKRPGAGRWQELLYLAPPPSASANTTANSAASAGGVVA